MEGKTVIRVDHVSKKFKVFLDKGVSIKERVLFSNRRKFEERQVLRDISFEVKSGEAIGLVGENGCGKSTMLKLLSRIMYPDAGEIEIKGRVSALIELGAGFHPDMSGRENIYTNASIFGLTKNEIDDRLQTIIDFSELGQFIDNPVRTYSSGMYMRLAFSVAINVDADILLIDEILAVGDVAFQAKCFNKLRDIKKRGTTIVIVSHSLGQIEQICDRSYWIENGLIRAEGNPYDVHQRYLKYMGERNENSSGTEGEDEKDISQEENDKRWGSQEITITQVKLINDLKKEANRLQSGKTFDVEIYYSSKHEVDDATFGIGVFRNDGIQCYGVNTNIDNVHIAKIVGDGKVVFSVEENMLLEGEYTLDVAIHRPDGFAYDYYRECLSFSVYSIVKDTGVMRLEHEWIIE